MNTFEQIADLERKYLLQTYNRYPVVLQRGKGVFRLRHRGQALSRFCFWPWSERAGPRASADREDDSGAGGETDPRLEPLLPRVSGAARRETLHAGGGSSGEKFRAFFSNSGTEAIEGSIKLARLAGHRVGGEAKCKLVGLEGSYHGRTFGALSLTGQDKHRKGFEPLLEDVTFVKQNDVEGLRSRGQRQYLRDRARADFRRGRNS